MNCKPNDVAMIVRNVHRMLCLSSLIGTYVEVESLHSTGMPFWNLKRPSMACRGCGFRFTLLADADLQPLRPPTGAVEVIIDASVQPPTPHELEQERLEWLGIGS
jgi:hypothetical protein